MARVYKATIYVTDYNDEIASMEHLEQRIEDRLGYWVGTHIAEIKESREFYWHDDLKINNRSATNEDFEEYFKEDK